MSEILENLFGSRAKTRLLRFFLLNPGKEFQFDDIVKRNMITRSIARKELHSLCKIKVILQRSKKGIKTYVMNVNFSFYPELRNLFVKSNIYPQCKSLGKVKNIGEVKLALISGTFLNYPKSKVDMVLVADNVSRVKLRNLMNGLEVEIGKEISYVLMGSDELKYRINMMDRFLMSFLEGPHDEIVNKVPGLKNFVSRSSGSR